MAVLEIYGKADAQKLENMVALKTIIAESCYSGRVTSDYDKKLLMTYANEWFALEFQEDERSK